MKKSMLILLVLCATVSQKLQADFVNTDYVKDIAIASYNQTIVWYTSHTALAQALAVFGVSYCLYRKYCPVASRCKECLEDSKNN